MANQNPSASRVSSTLILKFSRILDGLSINGSLHFRIEPAHHEGLATNVSFGTPCGLKSDVFGTLQLVRSCT
jgi:hypothetical protein